MIERKRNGNILFQVLNTIPFHHAIEICDSNNNISIIEIVEEAHITSKDNESYLHCELIQEALFALNANRVLLVQPCTIIFVSYTATAPEIYRAEIDTFKVLSKKKSDRVKLTKLL